MLLAMKVPQIRPAGDCAVSVEFENEISIAVNRQIFALEYLMAESPIEGTVETVPTYRALMVHYRPDVISFKSLCTALIEKAESLDRVSLPEGNVVELPVCYGGDFGFDMDTVAKLEGMTPEEVAKLHSANLNYVYALGFSPGLPYVGCPTETFHVPRLVSPRVRIPRGSIGVWQSQTTIVPCDQPCGWHIIGNTPVLLYDERRDQPSYFTPGQWVRFVPISADEYQEIAARAQEGRYQPRIYLREEAPL